MSESESESEWDIERRRGMNKEPEKYNWRRCQR